MCSLSQPDKKKFASGPDHGLWKGDDIVRRTGWSRAQRAYPSLGPCERCGADGYDRHHKDENTANNERDNVQVLCRRCHMEIDGRLERSRVRMLALQPKMLVLNRERNPYIPSPYRKGDPCPKCGAPLIIVGSRRRQDYVLSRIGCRIHKDGTGCGSRFGSIKSPIESHEEAA